MVFFSIKTRKKAGFYAPFHANHPLTNRNNRVCLNIMAFEADFCPLHKEQSMNRYTIFLLFISFLSFQFASIYAMDLASRQPLKRSKTENVAVIVVSKKEYNAALDQSLTQIDENGCTVLHVAAAEGNLKMCQDLLSRGADPRTQNKEGQSVLHVAVSENRYEIVQQLLQGMPKKAKQERILSLLSVLRLYRVPCPLRLKILSRLPELVTAYPSLCKKLLPLFMTFEELYAANLNPQLRLLELKNASGQTAYDIAKNHKNGFMARMTKPQNRIAVCKEEIEQLFVQNKPDSKENKE